MLQLNQDVEEAELTVHFVQGNQVEKKSFFLKNDLWYRNMLVRSSPENQNFESSRENQNFEKMCF